MLFLGTIIALCFGLIIGSFLNVCIYRYNTGKSVGGRSFCFSCGKTLHWYELVPLVSFLFQGGRCVGCKAKISWQYPLVESASALLFAGLFWRFPLLIDTSLALPFFFYTLFFSLLLVVFVYDLKHKIIPDGIVYTLIALSLVELFFTRGGALAFAIPSLWNLLAGPLVALPFFLIWKLSRGKYIGFGDIKLFVAVGWFFGLYEAFSAVTLSFWIGAVVGVILMYSAPFAKYVGLRKVTRTTEIPFGPFIIIGILFVFFFGLDVFQCALFLTNGL